MALEAATATDAPAAVEERNAFMDESSSGGDSDEAASDVDEVMDDLVLKYCAICRKSSEGGDVGWVGVKVPNLP